MPQERPTPEYYVTTANNTIWINGLVNCLGRFSPLGYEIYKEVQDEIDAHSGNTLAVKVQTMTDKDWSNFKTLMFEHHSISLDKEACPL